jgi:hypothetical protein
LGEICNLPDFVNNSSFRWRRRQSNPDEETAAQLERLSLLPLEDLRVWEVQRTRSGMS